jgi:hypothetical protein
VKQVLAIGILLVASFGCGDDLPRYEAVLRSKHFRLFGHAGTHPTAGMLDWLEAHYQATRAFLKFPDHVIDYHLFGSTELVRSACAGFPACTAEGKVYATFVPHEHELIHAYLAPFGHRPPLLEEGVADGLRCTGGPVIGGWPSWEVVAALPAAHQISVYDAGLALFGFLTRRFGVDAFVDYYKRARPTSDPDVFRQDFETYWALPLDQAWTEMQRSRNGTGGVWPVCPCTDRTTLPVDGGALDLGALKTLVVPLPDTDPGPYLFRAETGVSLRNCSEDYLGYDIAWLTQKPAGVTVARLLPERHYLFVDPRANVTAGKGGFLAATCEAAEPVPIPRDYAGDVSMLETRRRDEPPVSEWWSRFTLDGPRTIRIRPPPTSSDRLTICSTCDADGASCAAVPMQEGELTLEMPGPEVVLHATFALLPDTYRSAGFEILP